MKDLSRFLNQNGFKADNEDLQIILRRCDYDKDGKISFKEFSLLLDLPEEEASPSTVKGKSSE